MVGSAELREAGERGGPRTRRVVHTKECQWFVRRCGRHFKNAGCPSRPAGPLGCAPRPATAFDTRPPPPTTAFGIALPDRPRQTKQYGLGAQSWSRLATLTGLCWFSETTCRLPVFTVTDSRHPGSQGIAHFIPPSTFHTLIVSTASPLYRVILMDAASTSLHKNVDNKRWACENTRSAPWLVVRRPVLSTKHETHNSCH